LKTYIFAYSYALRRDKNLEDLLRLIASTRERAHKYGDLWCPETVPESLDGFGMIFNEATLVLELLDHYYSLWKNLVRASGSEIEESKKENAQRVLLITKWSFVDALSSIEYSIKGTLKTLDTRQTRILRAELQTRKRVYLSAITRAAKERELIDAEQYETWKGLIETRHAIVHSNAIADVNAK
jgi:hypothetical protein